jgi:Homeodomain-like domain
MPNLPNPLLQMTEVTQSVRRRAAQLMPSLRLSLHFRTALAAEHLFLKHPLALYRERHANSHRHQNVHRLLLVWLSYWFNWQPALTIVQPETFKRWRRQGWRLLWKTPSKRGRPPIPSELRTLIRQMARENLTWGQKRIANELRLKLGLQVSPRTVRKYMPSGCDRGPGQRVQGQRWRTFMRNYAEGLIMVTSRGSSAGDGQSYRRGSSSSSSAGRADSRQGNGGERRRSKLPPCSSDVLPGRCAWKTRRTPRTFLG